MSTKTNYKRLQENLEYLKLKQCLLHLDETIQLATTQHISHIEWLLQLTDYEVDVKRENVIHHMVKVSNFPHLKTLKDFDFTFQPQLMNCKLKIQRLYILWIKLKILYFSALVVLGKHIQRLPQALKALRADEVRTSLNATISYRI